MKLSALFVARLAQPALVLAAALAGAATSPAHAQSAFPPPPTLCLALRDWWTAPFDLGEALRDDIPAHVAAAENGDVMVIWYGKSGRRLAVQTRRYARAQNAFFPSWQAAMTAAPLKQGPAWVGPSVAMDSAGNAIAGWEQPDTNTGNQRIEVGRFARATNTWSLPTLLSPASDFAVAPVVSLRKDGKVGLALWQTIDNFSGKRALWWASYDAASGSWSAAALPLATNADADLAPAVAFAPDGYALLAYQYISGSNPRRVRVYGHSYDPAGQTWTTATLLRDTTYLTAAQALAPAPRVTIDGDGHGMALWRHRDPANLSEAVLGRAFDGASLAWSGFTQTLAGGLVPMPNLPPVDAVLGAALAAQSDGTTFVLSQKRSALGASLDATRRTNAAAPWDPRLPLPQPAMVLSIGDMALAGNEPSALWVQQKTANAADGLGIFASKYLPSSRGCPAQWLNPQHVADVSRLSPRLRSPARSASAAAVWVEPVADKPHVFASRRSSSTWDRL